MDDRTPHMGAFTFRNMECTGAEAAACYIDGLPESPIGSVTLEDIAVSFAQDAKPGMPSMRNHNEARCRMGLYLENVERAHIRNVALSGVEGEPLTAVGCGEIETEGFEKR